MEIDDNRVLHVSGEKKEQHKTKTSESSNFFSFSRSMTLPEDANEKALQAQFKDGEE